MYLSKLVLDPRPSCRAVLRDLASPYEMHRTILRAFPHADEGGPGRVLFRLEPRYPGHLPVVLVQSVKSPDWAAVERIPGYLAGSPAHREIDTSRVSAGRRLRFRLRANPTVKRDRKRCPLLREEDQRNWLARKAEGGGFRLSDFLVTGQARLTSRKTDGRLRGQRIATHLAVDFEGILEVAEPAAFQEVVTCGVGPAKGFGFGLLSVPWPS